jgi:hypothetical protein
MTRAVYVEPKPGWRLYVRFEDGIDGVVDVSTSFRGPMTAPLRDESFFRQVFLDEFGAVSWPNGYDLAPDALYDRLCKQAE